MNVLLYMYGQGQITFKELITKTLIGILYTAAVAIIIIDTVLILEAIDRIYG